MKEQFHIVLITVGLFAAGLLAGVWTQRTRPIPPPPAPVLGEFQSLAPPGFPGGGFAGSAGVSGPEFGGVRFSPGHPAAVAAMNAKIADLEPKIREFQEAVDSIEKELRGKLDRLLTPEQRKKLASIDAEEAPETAGAGPPPPPSIQIEGHGAERQHFMVGFHTPFPVGGWLMMSMIIYQPSLDHLTSALKLDAAQQAAVKALMVERRTELLALIDKSPPPTLGIGEPLP
jgi:hypothetical protein